ncbi:terpenoid cyclases/protein prenyltransferase alpha-alpha toroid [Chaetomidium leptoderma]|uniref:Terpenoid cyclases/protein prenyltransferase alpha-alpha toroid n=1 Tax=Chaetomidium leptoderma TaxID=669021 RepID=A0AAN6ZTZ6_9PEZI|nr:terpenoid cyclases/protein prenyltransferase alpha-alpha toroid [Chaetomidium leptoderma]
MADTPEQPEPVLDIARHLKYWKMCLQAPLPNHYLSNEGNRMALAYFIINSIRILTPPAADEGATAQTTTTPLIPPENCRKLRQWVLSHQQPGGGFAATSSLVFPVEGYEQWEPETGAQEVEGAGLANLPGTLFALQLLALLADEDGEAGAFAGVDRVQTLRWLRRLQREDGSFGEVLRQLPGHGWFIGGGYDMRYCYIAASVRWMLRGGPREGEPGWVEDFDTEALASYILRSQTYDGGFAGSSQEEPHAGYAYCAISALSLLDRPLTTTTTTPHHSEILHAGIRNKPSLIHWLASRQFVYLEPPPPNPNSDSDSDSEEEEVNFLLPSHPADLSLSSPPNHRRLHVACNGRCNKVADTCYTWWVGGALANLGHRELLDWPPSRRFLLEKMAHRIGGFSKHPGGPPDVYHACFGLTALAVMGESGLSELDGALAVPVRTVRVIEKARAALVVGNGKGESGGLVEGALEMGLAMRGTKPAWLSAVGG